MSLGRGESRFEVGGEKAKGEGFKKKLREEGELHRLAFSSISYIPWS